MFDLVQGKLEVTIKFNVLPVAKQVENGLQSFSIDADGQRVTATVKQKMWNKLTQAAKDYPQWVAALTGKMGKRTSDGFILEQPAIQVFEKKQKPEALTV